MRNSGSLRWGWILFLIIAALAVVPALGGGAVNTARADDHSTPTFTPIASQAQQAVAYQVNPAHDGATTSDTLNPPLSQRWSVDLGAPVSYPLIAEGKVFVTVRNVSGYGTKLYAIDATTGQVAWGPVAISGTYYWSNAAYDDGKLYVVNFDGVLQSYDAADGTLLWSRQLPDQYAFTSPPVAVQGVVYVSGAGTGGTLYAVNAANGDVLWTADVRNGDHSSPALSDDGVFVSYSCPNVYKLDRTTGAPLWTYGPGCSGGGGRTAVYHEGRLYVRDGASTPSGYVFDAQTGSLLGRYDAKPAPAFLGDLGFSVYAGVLRATSQSTGATVWTFVGDGLLSSAPIVVNEHVYVGSTAGNLYAVAANSGQLQWSTNVGSGIPAPDEHNVTRPLTGLNAGEGLLVVPAENLLVAFEGSEPSTPEPTATATPTSVPPTATATSVPPTPTATSVPPTSTATPTPTSTPTSTPTPITGKLVRVQDISLSIRARGPSHDPNYDGQANVLVVDSAGKTVKDAVVTAVWTLDGVVFSQAQGTTSGGGQVKLMSSTFSDASGKELAIVVTDIRKPGYVFDRNDPNNRAAVTVP